MQSWTGRAEPVTDDGFRAACEKIKCFPFVLWAVLRVETSGCGFRHDRSVQRRFEPHIFRRNTGITLPTFEAAFEADRIGAMRATSWGIGQVMGFNAEMVGYKQNGVEGMVATFADFEDAQLAAMAEFCVRTGAAEKLRNRDWGGFAAIYNGPAYKDNDYDKKLEREAVALATGKIPDLAVRSEQIRLMFGGHYHGAIDGLDGPKTRAAREEHLRSMQELYENAMGARS